VASVDTYLRFAEATNRLDLYEKGGKDLPDLVQGMSEGGARGKADGLLDAAADKFGELLGGGRTDEAEEFDEDEPEEEQPRRRTRSRERVRDR
jgi:hypothetical protein